MRSGLIICSCLLACSCNYTQERTFVSTMVNEERFMPPPSSGDNGSGSRTLGNRESFDSSSFHIIRRYYVSGHKFMESCEDSLTKLETWREWYESGQLKEEGQFACRSWPIGTWKFYASNGMLDSSIDYDKKYNISYFKALAIAGKRGYRMPAANMEVVSEKQVTYWQFIQCPQDQGGNSSRKCDVLRVNTKTGKATERKGGVMRYE